MSRSIHFAVAISLLLVSVSLCHTQSDDKQLKVTIVAVTEFDDEQLRDKDLLDSIKSARDGLQKFFVTNYNIVPTVLTTHDETKSDFLRTWLFRDLVHDSTPAVHLVFFLTHGFAVHNPDSSSFNSRMRSFWPLQIQTRLATMARQSGVRS
jgi:hypothetical protein